MQQILKQFPKYNTIDNNDEKVLLYSYFLDIYNIGLFVYHKYDGLSIEKQNVLKDTSIILNKISHLTH